MLMLSNRLFTNEQINVALLLRGVQGQTEAQVKKSEDVTTFFFLIGTYALKWTR